MSDQSARLGLPYVRAGQLQKHVTVNEALTRLDSVVQTTIESRSFQSPPPLVTEGQMFLAGGNPAGDWSGFAPGELLLADMGGWRRIEPVRGQLAVVMDEGRAIVWDGDGWRGLGEWLGALSVSGLGIGAQADDDNPFSARLNKALWAALPTDDGGDGDIRFTFNKQTSANTASVLFQSDWSGRAELGLTGDEDLCIKVSGDGTGWREAMRVDHATGRVVFDQGATRRETVAHTLASAVTIPDWVRWIEVTCMGGGGGGGAGRSGLSDVRRGGGGGGGGGISRAIFLRTHLGPVLTISPGGAGDAGISGAGGNGGDTTVSTQGVVILKAAGGHGGEQGGEGGPGGRGELTGANGAGTSPGGYALAVPDGSGFLPGAGGAGAGLSASHAVLTASAGGGGGLSLVTASGGWPGASGDGGAGGVSARSELNRCGGGGGGGAANNAGVGHAGGAGGLHGGGGGGGGAGTTGGGRGGAGAAGVVIVTMVG